jgi:4-methylaminobutanoate oxidase (formaldehyde-forming)
VGELGWELYVPTECATHAYDALFECAKENDIDLKPAGYYSLDSLRTEKGFRHWGHDISADETPLEAGMGFIIDW